MKTNFDVIIIGGGMVGASLARALAATNLRIAIIEAASLYSTRQPSYDDRAIALAYGTLLILEGIGVWPELEPDAEPIRHIHISDRGRFGFTRLDHQEQGVAALGYVATGHALGQVLLKGLGQLSNLMLFCPASLNSFDLSADGVEVRISLEEGEQILQGKLLVAADGVNSLVREQLDISIKEWGYGQTAVISNLTPGIEPEGVAFERFTDAGPMALLPLTGGRYGLVWTLDDADLDAVMGLDEAAFLERVQGRFGYRLGQFQKAGKRSCYPLKLVRASEHIRQRVALIGNAAHAVHPITGQGFNLGIRDVAVLADVLVDAAKRGQDIGSLPVLERYADWRKHDQEAVALMTDSLVRIFTNPLLPVRMIRNLSMLALDLMPGPKRFLTRQFMGLNGRLPKLSRGRSLV
ncbi:2-octaprenyl-6-methoxyphenyl hydroxylase [Candidatus Vondammii sp. HM_W22]|uniref:2-octaprenyl-6-methoxyphenyl hydroxylase n=1 Tax=Candidatus Vondammii sp. HM_W22 TaxID=2687299 RepID=UPI001F148C2D|nr:2-octaprenyl-6-methoxyphenyl hydroxylase [Candidatus Vondammii sp. HM_W22]